MRRSQLVLWWCVAGAMLSVQVLRAEQIAADLLEYPPGELHGLDGGSGWAGPWTAVAFVTEVVDTAGSPMTYVVPGGAAVHDGERAIELLPNDDNALSRELAEPEDSDQVFISFLFRFEGQVDDNDFIGLWFDDAAAGTHQEVPSIGLKANQGDGSGPLDFFARTVATEEAYAGEVEPEETYLIVGRLSKDGGGPASPYVRYELWVNPRRGDLDTPHAVAEGESIASFARVGVRVPTLSLDDVAMVARLTLGTSWDDVVPAPDVSEPLFRRGDADSNGMVNLTDAVYSLMHLFLSGPAPTCLDAADSNDDGDVQLTDAVFLLSALFRSGSEPPAPGYRTCGPDPTEDSLGCASYPPCD